MNASILDWPIAQCQQVLVKHLAQLAEHERILAELRAWQAQLLADNQNNPDPPPYIELAWMPGSSGVRT